MSDWRLAWVKTRAIQGLAGAYEEVVAWKEADEAWAREFLRCSDLVRDCMRDLATPKLWCGPTDSPPTMECAPLHPPATGKPPEDPR